MELIIYNSSDRTFSSAQNKILYYSEKPDFKWGSYWKLAAATVGVATLAEIVKLVSKRYHYKAKDSLLTQRNTRINQLARNYAEEGFSAETNPTLIKKYYNELTQLTAQTIAIERESGKYKDSHRADYQSPNTFNMIIAPYIALLQVILVRGVHVIAGTEIGADRRSFEIVFDPDHINVEDVVRDPFRTVVFKYPWPSHGFKVKSSVGDAEANKLIDATNKFLAENPKFLSIRLR